MTEKASEENDDAPEIQFLSGAFTYIRSARLLRFSNEWETEAPALLRPTLHLLSHGMELLLKTPLLQAGATPDALRKDYGHDLRRLWDHADNYILRELLLFNAEISWREASVSGLWPEDSFDRDPRQVFVESVNKLSRLHSRESDFALRYLVKREEPAPHSAFLIDTLSALLSMAIYNPAIFKPAKKVVYSEHRDKLPGRD